jgi:hypothetical protein
MVSMFRIKERMTFNIGAEFINVFNRTQPNGPTSTNPQATQTPQLHRPEDCGLRIHEHAQNDLRSVAAGPDRRPCAVLELGSAARFTVRILDLHLGASCMAMPVISQSQ